VLQDIDAVHRQVQQLQQTADDSGRIRREQIKDIADEVNPVDLQAFYAALNWVVGGMKSIFIQDANSLIIKPADLIKILKHLRTCFPWAERITSYARSHTVARIKADDLNAMKNAGLNRIHIGLESGSDEVLKKVMKGVSKATQIKRCLKSDQS
jgi:coproporphyrinogen III oxidase-like Fe-S oxidoreductase